MICLIYFKIRIFFGYLSRINSANSAVNLLNEHRRIKFLSIGCPINQKIIVLFKKKEKNLKLISESNRFF